MIFAKLEGFIVDLERLGSKCNIGKFWVKMQLWRKTGGKNMNIGNLWTKTRLREIWDKNMNLGIFGIKT